MGLCRLQFRSHRTIRQLLQNNAPSFLGSCQHFHSINHHGSTKSAHKTFQTPKSTVSSMNTYNIARCRVSPFTQPALCRNYSGGGEDSEKRMKFFVVKVPGPIAFLKNIFYTTLIRSKLDPQFSIDDFKLGARQALCYVFGLVRDRNFEEIKNVATAEVVSSLQSMSESWPPEKMETLDITDEDIVLCMGNINKFSHNNNSGSYDMDVAAVIIAQKIIRDTPWLLEATIIFSRELSLSSASSWIITGIKQIKVNPIPGF